jgi:hypothetical protein
MIGFSDTPAWKVAQAQMLAQFHGWAPLVALQIEYSLLERTVEGELIPMAIEMSLGVTTWSPLKNGALSGKYTRENVNAVKPDRGELVTSTLGDRVPYKPIVGLIPPMDEGEPTRPATSVSLISGEHDAVLVGAALTAEDGPGGGLDPGWLV